MKISVPLIIEMTPEQIKDYCFDYNVKPSEVRQSVRDHILAGVQSATEGDLWAATINPRQRSKGKE